MIILPAIDLKEGKCVRLHKGVESKVTYYFDNPLEVAHNLVKEGAEYIHIIDLDGAFNKENNNLKIIESIASSIDIPLQIGGGIRSLETAENLISMGVNRIILGTVAIENPQFVKKLVEKYSDKIAVSLDCYGEKVAVKGWVEKTEKNLFKLCKEFKSYGISSIIYTDIERDGTLSGPNLVLLERLQKTFGDNIIAAGGLSSVKDLVNLKKIGLYGTIVGKALYEGKITMEDIRNFERE
ncbi:1-(5-phosphoribosyl)-5-[(5-phosphoribosylamino)methylideneamino]imidazole-4-carboxamide isomerase [Anaerosphaera multitolerans]|uniref:1-(5-phosphoribosyl)-5-[(5-phosphoribosylamino)methylideneamino] imidazole-4-carboxamide isomerase n=1 Tax=Anaerosphaera multitolerans TaxID=2487351 RepID=A0A437S5T0_9FIRM|nr:1-(5-phosphoribosyl)-5-[(5-phosphoribosylamino)methylideneamino]imidazole-4-carboxamide isomerase [Anaerosphaera multitolerans]RVU54266.1 1-(5-phosphoribosyl)-5-[(5-phosphoribosylamino)methylideneamino]imidazole-4-carboxamide isomerase [Anaerosphaera multitolerans]